jgi:general secretion pathway protein A
MYLQFFGLREPPFNVTPDPKFLHLSRQHEEALTHLRYGIEERKGFIVLTGEVGCGKTTVCRLLLNELDHDRYDTALILNPRLGEEELLLAILSELGVKPQGKNRTHLINQLNKLLLERIAAGKRIVLIIDESQNLSFEVLEHLRLLSNLETDTQKLLQIILLGQPELKAKLQEKRLRQLRQRILVHCELNPLDRDEVRAYLQHRLSVAGANGRPRFTSWAIRRIHANTGGVPRMINNLCDKALLSAYIRSSDEVSWFDVGRAIRDITL